MMRNCWAPALVGAFALAWAAGCSHPCYMTEGDLHQCVNGPLPSEHAVEAVANLAASTSAVSTVVHPEGEHRPISLQECIAIALEKGRVGGTNIRVLAFDPAVTQTTIEQSLSTFDARWRTSMTWNTVDERIGTLLQTALNNATNSQDQFIQQDNALFNTEIVKPLPTGGTAGIAFRTQYEFDNLNAAVNPSYRPRLVFNLEQPLLQGAGVEINQVRSGILLARLNLDTAHATFCGNVNDLLFTVEEAYWNLYFAYYNLFVQTQAMEVAYTTWQRAKAVADAGGDVSRAIDLPLLEQQYQGFRLARLDALGGPGNSVLESERQLRLLIGLPPEDCTRLIPTDTPTSAPVCPDWCTSLDEALQNRPDLVILRQDISRARLEVKRALDLTKPDLRAIASYDINGLGNRLDGSDSQMNALRNLATNHFHDWTVGLQLDIPIGFRNALSQARRAKLQLERSLVLLKDRETQATFGLQRSYRAVVENYERVQIVRALRDAAQKPFNFNREQFMLELDRKGQVPDQQLKDRRTLEFVMLQLQRDLIAIQRDEQRAIFDYNIALADFERQKGTIMRFDNVSIAEGQVPVCVQARASEHIRQRDSALLVRERPAKPDGGAPAGPGPVADGPAGVPPTVGQFDRALRAGEAPRTLPDSPTEAAPLPRTDSKAPGKQ